MTLNERVIEELGGLSIKMSCCYKAYLCGMLFGCVEQENRRYKAFFYKRCDAESVAELIDSRFPWGQKTEVTESARGGHKGYSLIFGSKSLSKVFSDIDGARTDGVSGALGFRCAECAQHFLRGVFISSSVLSSPKSGYHLEMSFPNEQRAKLVNALLEDELCRAGQITRGKRACLYYKSNTKVFDFLYYIGAAKTCYDIFDLSIERDIINRERRRVNCEMGNLARVVGATRKHVDAINYLVSHDRMSLLSADLEYTARLRIENDDVSLRVLASLHTPPITKSGLNARLAKILAIANEQMEIEQGDEK